MAGQGLEEAATVGCEGLTGRALRLPAEAQGKWRKPIMKLIQDELARLQDIVRNMV